MVELLRLGPLHVEAAVPGAGEVGDQRSGKYKHILEASVHFLFSPNIIMGLGMFELSQVEFSAC